MTGEEAKKAFWNRVRPAPFVTGPGIIDQIPEWVGQHINGLVAIGALKLDEPEPILCKENPDWNWWLLQSNEFKAEAVRNLRANNEIKMSVKGDCNGVHQSVNDWRNCSVCGSILRRNNAR